MSTNLPICCDRFSELVRRRYIDHNRVFEQRTNIDVGFPDGLRNIGHCLICGDNMNVHRQNLINNPNGCRVISAGGQLGRYDISPDWSRVRFNLETVAQSTAHRNGDINNPEPVRIFFCPYCGTQK